MELPVATARDEVQIRASQLQRRLALGLLSRKVLQSTSALSNTVWTRTTDTSSVVVRGLVHFVLLFALLTIVSGCATVRSSGTKQALLVQTSPPGASLNVKGRSAGQSPKYILIDRGHEMSVDVASAEGPIRVPLKKSYRWGQSFFPNLIFLSFAPIGWLVDLVSGAAWEAQPPPTLQVRLSAADQAIARAPKRADVVAIAPPLTDQLNLSDTGGQAIESQLNKEKANVIPYQSSLPTFLGNDYDYDGAPKQEDRAALYYALGATKIYESTVVPQDDHFILKARERNVYTGTLHSGFQVRLEPESSIDRVFTKNVWWSRLLPNTLAVDFVDTRIQLQRGDKSYDLTNTNDDAWWAVTMRYLSALNITSLPPRRYGRSARWAFNLVPVLRVSRREVVATSLPSINPLDTTNEEYTRWLLSGGYGGEVGWQVSRHYLYFNAAPVLYWSQISWKAAEQNRSVTNIGVQFAGELGYILYFNTNWHARFFSRTQQEDAAGWSEALNTRLPSSAEATTASLLVAGISVGYRFEPGTKARVH